MFRQLKEFISEPLAEANQLQQQHLADRTGPEWRTPLIMVSVAILLTIRSYFFNATDLLWLIRKLSHVWPDAVLLLSPQNYELTRLAYWAIGQDLVYAAVPLLLIKFVFRESLADYGLKLKGMFRFGTVYLAMFLVMAPLIAWLSTTDSFQRAYPFYELSPGERLWPRLIAWELLYASQFITLEFFFRGFIVHGTKRQYGAHCIFVMMVPYCMIHFSKPLPETCGAIIAGVALGLMSLKTKSIWMGAALHISVAWSMDIAALLSR